MTTFCSCGCGEPLEPTGMGRPPEWVNDAHRKRAAKVRAATKAPIDGPLTVAVRVALAASDDGRDAIDAARAQLALELASIVEARGPSSVSAAKELRAVLSELADDADDGCRALVRGLSDPRLLTGE
jgi:hypothetical protein